MHTFCRNIRSPMRSRRRLVVLATVLAGCLAVPSASFANSVLSITGVPIAPVEGQQLSGPLATVVDSEGADVASAYTATIEWGDGVIQTGTVTVTGEEIAVSGTHIYAEEGTFTIAVGIEDEANHLTVSESTTIIVPDAPLSVPFGSPTTFNGHGAALTNTALGAFEAGIGGTNNGTTAGEQQVGFRHINWDGIALDGSAPGTTVLSPGKTVALPPSSQQERGLELDSPLAVTGDSFASINPEAGGLFTVFSSANLVAPFNTNVLALNIVAPGPPGGTPTRAATRGLGVVFLNVGLANTTSIEYLNGETVLGKFFASVGGHDQPSFLGVLFNSSVVTRVVITLGTAEILGFNGSFPESGLVSDTIPNNLVAADDVILAEPAPDRPILDATAGTLLSAQLGTFQDANPNAVSSEYSATVDWGDGARTVGLIAPDASGRFTVSGSHTYAQGGSFPIIVVMRDLGGAHLTLHAIATVAPNPSSPGITTTTSTSTSTSTSPVSSPPNCSITVPSAHLASVLHGTASTAKTSKPSSLRMLVRCDQNASLQLAGTVTLKGKGKKSKTKTLPFGQATATAVANHPTTVKITASAQTLGKLRAAARHHQKISLKLTLTATSQGKKSTTAATVANLLPGT